MLKLCSTYKSSLMITTTIYESKSKKFKNFIISTGWREWMRTKNIFCPFWINKNPKVKVDHLRWTWCKEKTYKYRNIVNWKKLVLGWGLKFPTNALRSAIVKFESENCFLRGLKYSATLNHQRIQHFLERITNYQY